ncbi:Uncharacterized protein Nst1_089 [Candidatus Nanobsidianus stetteri]|uniref:Uncharacterized protein n=1 Tax=Nanobsidianus stetteri TaxID=1294122 RepID=R1FUG2_NANST|nr:Uncharacterized protein Nst1_089 [Candidatus Nanobsidianus stetteri]
MPVNAIEIVLITLILFFISQSMILYFNHITNPSNYDKIVLNYIGSNVEFCIYYSYLYDANLFCQPSQNYKFSISAINNFVYISYNGNLLSINLNNNSYFHPIYGQGFNSFFLQYKNYSSNSILYIS